MVWHGHILSSDIGLVFWLVLLAIGLVLSHRPGNPAQGTDSIVMQATVWWCESVLLRAQTTTNQGG